MVKMILINAQLIHCSKKMGAGKAKGQEGNTKSKYQEDRVEQTPSTASTRGEWLDRRWPGQQPTARVESECKL